MVKRVVAYSEFAKSNRRWQTHYMNLARIRKLRGLNLRELAEMVGLDASTIQRAETMQKTAKLETYQKCADVLGVRLYDLFADDRAPIEVELLRIFRNIPPEKHQELLGLLSLAQAHSQPKVE